MYSDEEQIEDFCQEIQKEIEKNNSSTKENENKNDKEEEEEEEISLRKNENEDQTKFKVSTKRNFKHSKFRTNLQKSCSDKNCRLNQYFETEEQSKLHDFKTISGSTTLCRKQIRFFFKNNKVANTKLPTTRKIKK